MRMIVVKDKAGNVHNIGPWDHEIRRAKPILAKGGEMLTDQVATGGEVLGFREIEQVRTHPDHPDKPVIKKIKIPVHARAGDPLPDRPAQPDELLGYEDMAMNPMPDGLFEIEAEVERDSDGALRVVGD